MRELAGLLGILAVLLSTAGCGSDEPTTTIRTAANGDEFTEADVEFATDVIVHHSQTLSLLDLTSGRPIRPRVRQVAEDVRESRTAQIEEMTGWLTAWGERVPEPDQHTAPRGNEDGEEEGEELEWLSAQEISDLAATPDARFQDRWLEVMIEHNDGAVDLAQAAMQHPGVHFDPAYELANAIESALSAEIELMQNLLWS